MLIYQIITNLIRNVMMTKSRVFFCLFLCYQSNLRHVKSYYSSIVLQVTTWFFLLLLVACQPQSIVPSDDLTKLPTQVDGASDATITQLQSRLNHAGARVITIGQNYLIIIPSTLLFPTQSPQVMWESYALLNDLACYLKQFRKVSIHINAFSSPFVSREREHALTLARARTVADYLWSQGVDSRFIFTQGLGSDKPIGQFKQCGDDSPNSRIEITFRRTIV